MAHPDRAWRLIDRVFGIAFAAALGGAALTALPLPARAADAVIQASGPQTTEQRPAGEFKAISVSGGIDLKLTQASAPAITVRAEANVLPYLETVIEDGRHGKTLQVRWKKGSKLRVKESPLVQVAVVELSAVHSAGSSDVEVGPLKTPGLVIGIAGAGDIKLQAIDTEDLSVSISGSGDVQASGQATKLQLRISGSGEVQADALKADDVTISIAGSGDAAVQAAKTLSVSIAGSGDVVYRGDAQVKTSIAGSGNVRKR